MIKERGHLRSSDYVKWPETLIITVMATPKAGCT
jgi:hypothetical protein